MAGLFHIIFPLLAFLFPLALYCLALAYLNRSRRPVVVAGIWDFLGLLFGLSGFLMFTMPVLLNYLLIARIMDYLPGAGEPAVVREWVFAIRVTYFVLVAAGIGMMLIIRRHKTAVFNVDTEQFDHRLGRALAELGLDSIQRAGRWTIAPVERFRVEDAITARPAALAGSAAKVLEGPPGGPRYAELAVDTFPAFCHVTIHWESYSSALRDEIERQLSRTLADATALDNPASGWFLGFSGMCMFVITLISIFFVVMVILARTQ